MSGPVVDQDGLLRSLAATPQIVVLRSRKRTRYKDSVSHGACQVYADPNTRSRIVLILLARPLSLNSVCCAIWEWVSGRMPVPGIGPTSDGRS